MKRSSAGERPKADELLQDDEGARETYDFVQPNIRKLSNHKLAHYQSVKTRLKKCENRSHKVRLFRLFFDARLHGSPAAAVSAASTYSMYKISPEDNSPYI